VNCHGRVQRIGRAFPPLEDSREDWRFLLELADKLNLKFEWSGPEDIFEGLAKAVTPFEGLTHERIGTQGVDVATAAEGNER
jgi:formate dehydrogenase alpha subunit